MVRFFNPVDPKKRKNRGIDNQLHGGTMESVDQVSNAIAKTVSNVGDDNEKKK